MVEELKAAVLPDVVGTSKLQYGWIAGVRTSNRNYVLIAGVGRVLGVLYRWRGGGK